MASGIAETADPGDVAATCYTVVTELASGLPPVLFDPAQLKQVLVNLLKNAAEASEGSPEIVVRVIETADGGACLQVLDRGCGMEEETMKRALLPFYSTKKTGSGLGLALCREIVEGHGGRISLQQRQGGGTVVSCWFPDHQ